MNIGAGAKILDGLRDALDGNFTRVEQGDVAFIKFKRTFRQAGNFQAWALGYKNKRGQFHVRRVVWGTALARVKKRDGEIIRRVHLIVNAK